ncbi:hypothetical protein N9L43_00920 [bacterium]|nr:hypothetical protein [bacterium]
MKNMKWIWMVVLFIGFGASAQPVSDQQLAQHYFDNEEYDKAVTCFPSISSFRTCPRNI